MNNPLVQLDPGLFVWTILTFLLLLFLLAKFAWKPLLKMLREREELIRSSLADAEKAKTELSRLNAEGQQIINQARAEAQEILVQGKAVASRLKEDTLKEAKDKANSILKDAQKQIQVEKEKAILEIKSEVVNLSVAVAEKLIRKNISAGDNQELIDETLKKMKDYEA